MSGRRLYKDYLLKFRILDPIYRAKYGYRKAQREFSRDAIYNFFVRPDSNNFVLRPDDQRSRLFVLYLLNRYMNNKNNELDREINRLKQIVESGENYVEYRKKLDELRYDYFKHGNYIGREPKIYKEYQKDLKY